MENEIRTIFDKRYRKLGRNEIIEEGARHTWQNGELMRLNDVYGNIIGKTPADFSDDRDFYNLV
jgi:hypothetical protein